MQALITLVLVTGLGVGSLALLLLMDRRADRLERKRLTALQPAAPEPFDPRMVADLPDPARRYFSYTIRPGTPILTVVEIEMRGQFSLGAKEAPNYQPMQAHQILAAPEGDQRQPPCPTPTAILAAVSSRRSGVGYRSPADMERMAA